MKLTKKIFMLFIITIVSITFVSCTGGSYSTRNSTESNWKNKMEMTYDSFKGYRYTMVDLKSGSTLLLNIDVETKGGNLTVSLIDEDKNKIYSVENPDKTINEKINIIKDGKYKIKVEGEHEGSYKITWDVE